MTDVSMAWLRVEDLDDLGRHRRQKVLEYLQDPKNRRLALHGLLLFRGFLARPAPG